MKFLYLMNICIAVIFSTVHLFGSFFLSESILNSNIFDYILATMSAIVLASMMIEKFKLYIDSRINIGSIFLAILVVTINIVAIKVNAGLFFFSMFPVYLLGIVGTYLGNKLISKDSYSNIQEHVLVKALDRVKKAGALLRVLLVGALYSILVFIEGRMITIFAMNVCRAILLLLLDIRSERMISGQVFSKDVSNQMNKTEVQKEQEPLSIISSYSSLSLSNLLYANVLLFVCAGVVAIIMPFLLASSLLTLGLIFLIPIFLVPLYLLIWLFLRILRKQAGIPTYVFFVLILLLMVGISNGLFLLVILMVGLIYLMMNGYFPDSFDRYFKNRDFKE